MLFVGLIQHKEWKYLILHSLLPVSISMEAFSKFYYMRVVTKKRTIVFIFQK